MVYNLKIWTFIIGTKQFDLEPDFEYIHYYKGEKGSDIFF